MAYFATFSPVLGGWSLWRHIGVTPDFALGTRSDFRQRLARESTPWSDMPNRVVAVGRAALPPTEFFVLVPPACTATESRLPDGI